MNAPALRLLIPLAAGIAVTSDATPLWVALATGVMGVVLYAAFAVTGRTPSRWFALRRWWSLPIALMLFSLGMATAAIHRPPTLDTASVKGRVAEVYLEDIVRKDFSMNLMCRIDAVDGQPLQVSPHILVTTRGCDYTITPGRRALMALDLEPITNLGNPDESDYARLMLRRGYRYRQHLSTKSLLWLNPSTHAGFTERLARWRWELELRVMHTSTSPFTQQLVIAMFLGDNRVVDEDVRLTFSHAGVAHILALSGLHVGIIAWLVWLLLFPLDYLGARRTRLLVTLAALALFAVFSGLSPSVVRASLMIGAAFTGQIILRRGHPLNAIAVAALAILVFSPQQLFSIGFQLSFVTVASLLVFSSQISPGSSNRFIGYALSTLATTVIATMSTLMLSAYYFHTVSLIGWLSNLVLLPVVPVAIVLGAVMCFTCACGMEYPVVSWLTDAVCGMMRRTAETLAGFTPSHIDGIYVDGVSLVLYTVALVMLAWWLMSRRKALIIISACALSLMSASMLVTRITTPSSGLVVFNDFKVLPVLAYQGGEGLLWIPDADEPPESLAERFARHHDAFLAHHGIRRLTCVTDSAARLHDISIRPPFALIHGQCMLALQRKSWQHLGITGAEIRPDVILLTRTFGGELEQVIDTFGPSTIVTAAPVTGGTTARSISIHHLNTSGAWQRRW